MIVRAETLERSAVQIISVIWMSDADEQFGSLLERFAEKIHGTILCYNPVCVRSWSDYTGTVLKCRDDFSHTLFGPGGEYCYGLAALRHCGTPDEIHLSASP